MFKDLYDLFARVMDDENANVSVTINGKPVDPQDLKKVVKEEPKGEAKCPDCDQENCSCTAEDMAGYYATDTTAKYDTLGNKVAKLAGRAEYVVLKTVNGLPLDDDITITFDSKDGDLYVPGITPDSLFTILKDIYKDNEAVIKGLKYAECHI